MRIPPHIETDDLVSSGVVGLLDALNRYDDSRGIKFKTYAEFRIRGAMLDYLREMDWFPGRAAALDRLQQTYTRLENILGRARRKRRSLSTWGSPSTSFASSWRRSWG